MWERYIAPTCPYGWSSWCLQKGRHSSRWNAEPFCSWEDLVLGSKSLPAPRTVDHERQDRLKRTRKHTVRRSGQGSISDSPFWSYTYTYTHAHSWLTRRWVVLQQLKQLDWKPRCGYEVVCVVLQVTGRCADNLSKEKGERRKVGLATTAVHGKKFARQRPRSTMLCKNPEKVRAWTIRHQIA